METGLCAAWGGKIIGRRGIKAGNARILNDPMGIFRARQAAMQIPVPLVTVGLLTLSNIFMTFAWYGHLRYKGAALPLVILTSWGIAFFEYLLQVPANRIGYGYFSAAELKTIQEVISLSVFMLFSTFWLHESLRWNHILGFALIVLAAWVIFKEW